MMMMVMARNWSRQTPNPKLENPNPNPTEACGNCVSSLDTRSEQLKRAASQAGKRWPRQRRPSPKKPDSNWARRELLKLKLKPKPKLKLRLRLGAGHWHWLQVNWFTAYKKDTQKKEGNNKKTFQAKVRARVRTESETWKHWGETRAPGQARPPVNGTQAPQHHSTAAPQAPHWVRWQWQWHMQL